MWLLRQALLLGTAIVAATVLAACGDDDDRSSAAATTTATRTADDPAVRCSASGLELDLIDQPALPAAVARTRRRLFDAATACDFEALGSIAAENTRGFAFTFGDEQDPVAYWRRVDATERTMRRLAQLLTTPVVRRQEGEVTYAWPSVYQDAPSPEDYDALVRSGAYTREQAERFQSGGSYLGYRISVTPEGTWNFFTAGD